MNNPYILVPLAVWAISQLLKFTIAAFKGRVDFRYLYASGGMPSVHSAVVCSLATTALILDGSESHLFGLTAILAAIVMYDSFGVRRASGEQAQAINMLIASLDEGKVRLAQPHLKLREVLGHKPEEVAVGAVLGTLLAALFNIDQLDKQLSWLQTAPAALEWNIYAIVFALLGAGGWIARFWMARKWRGSASVRSFARAILVKTQVIGWTGLALALAQWQGLGYFAWRVWPILLLLALAAWDLWLFPHYLKAVPADLEQERETARKQKWLQPKKRKK